MSFDILKPDLSDILPEGLRSPDEASTAVLQDSGICYSLRVKKVDLASFKKASGWNLPAKIGGTVVTRTYTAFCLGPDEWQIITAESQKSAVSKKLEKLAKKFIYSYADISQRNVTFDLTGPLAARMINIGCPLDLSSSSFPIGKCTRTVFEDAEIMIHRTAEDAFAVQTWRSFGPYLVSFLTKFLEDQR